MGNSCTKVNHTFLHLAPRTKTEKPTLLVKTAWSGDLPLVSEDLPMSKVKTGGAPVTATWSQELPMTKVKTGGPPPDKHRVIVSFLADDFIPGSIVDLGVHHVIKSRILAAAVGVRPFQDRNRYTFADHGFECAAFDEDTLQKLAPVYQLSQGLTPESDVIDDYHPILQHGIDVLESWIEKHYRATTGLQNIKAVCSRHLILRLAGCSAESLHIPGNPLLHLDYISFDAAYERMATNQEEFAVKVISPPRSQLIDVVNVWFPTAPIEDWALGFLFGKTPGLPPIVPIELVVGSKAAAPPLIEDCYMVHKAEMDVPEFYFFRSSPSDDGRRPTRLHCSYRTTDKYFIRRSVEIRCLIFKCDESGGASTFEC